MPLTGRRWRAARRATVVALAAALLAGCQYDGPGSLPLPLREGVGDGSYEITVEVDQVANLVPNAEVKVDDVTVGVVKQLDVQNWHAVLTVGLNPEVALPANAEARTAQKSLLGAEYLELAPPTSAAPAGRLRGGDRIPLARTGRYPETEEVLAALSVVLNGGGLQQVKTITSELDRALSGREGDLRALVGNLGTLVGTLDRQRGDIVRSIESLNRLSVTLGRDEDTINRGLAAIPPALTVLEQDREALVETLRRTGVFGDVAVRVLNRTRDDLLTNLRQLRPALARLADSGSNLTESLTTILTFPFPSNTAFPRMLNGDYGNLFLVLDLTPAILQRNFLSGFDLPMLPSLLKAPPLGAGQRLAPPFAPFLGRSGLVPGSSSPSSGAGSPLPVPLPQVPRARQAPSSSAPTTGLLPLDGLLSGGGR